LTYIGDTDTVLRMAEPPDHRQLHGALVRARRKELGLSQVELAERSRLTQGNVSQIESGAIGTTDSTRVALAEALETRARLLFPYADDVPEEAAS
jgi:transcriptional regulator with XRE-family HTH domain